MRNVKRYVIPTIFVLVVAGMGTLFTNSGMEWFDTLKRPSEWLPDFVIPIVWTIIYLSFWIFTITNDYYLYPRLTNLLVINGFVNVLWCLIYFVINSLLGGLIVIVLFVGSYISKISQEIQTNTHSFLKTERDYIINKI